MRAPCMIAIPLERIFLRQELRRCKLKQIKSCAPIYSKASALGATRKVCNKCLQKALISIECASTSERSSELFFKKLIKQCVWVLELEVDKLSDKHTCINLFSSFAIV